MKRRFWDLDECGARRIARTLSDHVVTRKRREIGFGIANYGPVAAGYPLYEGPQKFSGAVTGGTDAGRILSWSRPGRIGL